MTKKAIYTQLHVSKIQSSFLYKSLFRAYADYQAEWAAGGLMTTFIRIFQKNIKQIHGDRNLQRKTFLGDDGRPDWVARKTCNYLTGSIEVRELDF